MRKYGRFSEDIVKSFTRQVLEGLAYLHEMGILHRVCQTCDLCGSMCSDRPLTVHRT